MVRQHDYNLQVRFNVSIKLHVVEYWPEKDSAVRFAMQAAPSDALKEC